MKDNQVQEPISPFIVPGHWNVLDAKREAAKLQKELHAHNHAYYVLGQPTLTDAAYDDLFRKLVAIEAKWPQTNDPNSPTCRVGSPVMSSFQKVQHARKMLSLENSYSAEEVTKFFSGNQELIVEPKIDGLSLSLVYKNGHLVKAVTRGDGTTGDDVTSNARVIRSIPLELSMALDVEVRGEVYMPISVFESLNADLAKEGEDLFANPRNAAAGTLKQKDSRTVAKRRLGFIAYNVGSPINLIEECSNIQSTGADHGTRYHFSHESVLLRLGSLGFITPLRCPMRNGTVDFFRKVDSSDTGTTDFLIKEMAEIRERVDLQTDGLVFKINDLNTQSELGDGTRAPKWATAYKFPPERKQTKLVDIAVSIGRFGTLTPVAILEPVQLSGTTVERASLCNQDEVQRLGINIGDTVYVEKSAEIIPKVMGLAKKGQKASFWLMPKACPVCGAPVIKDPVKVAYRCPNKLRCPTQAVERLKHALGKSALDWDGFGEEMVATAVANGLTQLSQLFETTDSKLNDAFKPAFVKKFKKERERVQAAPLWRKIHALGIGGIGKSLSQDLCAKYNTLVDMVNDSDGVRNIVGDVFGANFYDFILENVDEIELLETYGFSFSESVDRTGPLTGKTFCITGGLTSGKRPQVEARIMEVGGAVKSSVTKKVDFLIVGESPGADKTGAAKKHGTRIITEEQLYEMMGVPMPKAASNLLEERGEI